jgi:hypothetical protein
VPAARPVLAEQPSAPYIPASACPIDPMPTMPTRLPASSRPPSVVCGHSPRRTAASASTVLRSRASVADRHHSATLVVLAPAAFATGIPAAAQASTSMVSKPTLGIWTNASRGPGACTCRLWLQSPSTTSTVGSSASTAACVRSGGTTISARSSSNSSVSTSSGSGGSASTRQLT